MVWAEVAAAFPSPLDAAAAMQLLTVAFSSLNQAGALIAGAVFAQYHRGGGRRDRVVADFLVGGHALVQADRLLTRDRGFYRSYFAELEVIDPSP